MNISQQYLNVLLKESQTLEDAIALREGLVYLSLDACVASRRYIGRRYSDRMKSGENMNKSSIYFETISLVAALQQDSDHLLSADA